ncbi:MAG: DegT/DnrJ/EryC1/StrS family aminotransferase [Roseovarius sp.]|nr:DegT/DnrJ/EryC1/StrS family aminotransferase [Roseovarius sp.]
MSNPLIPVNDILLTDADKALAKDAIDTAWISSAGAYISQFENDWAAACGVNQGVALSNGTTALEIAVETLGIGPGDEVIMTTHTIISCALAVTKLGAVPVVVDVDPTTWCMDVDQIAARITPRTRAIMVVHIFGHPVDMDPVLALARKHDLKVIEDAAEVHGAAYLTMRDTADAQWKRCGGMSDIATFSFFANKLITTGEGGMIVTDNAEYADRARSLINLCFRPDRRFRHTELGHQFRMTNMQAALGVSQVARIEEIVERKRWAAGLYHEGLSDMGEFLTFQGERDWAKNVYWVNGMVLSDDVPFDAAEFALRLREQGIDSRPFFWNIHEQPVYLEQGLFRGETYPVAERITRRGLYVPSGLAITEAQIERVCATVKQILRG